MRAFHATRGLVPALAAGALGVAIALAGLLPLSAPRAAAGQRSEMENPFQGDPDGIAYGRKRFAQRCMFCHGSGGRGAKGPDLTDDKWKFGGRNEDVFYTVAAGRQGTQMGAFGRTLDSDEIWKIIAYLRDENRKRHESGELHD